MTHDRIMFRDVVRGSVLVLLGCLVLAYIVFQARFLIVGPQITLTQELPTRHNERVITLHGTTANIARLYLNGRPIFTDPQGTFAADVVLENGYTVTTLEAQDRYGRHTTLTREFVYTPMSFTQK